MGVRAAPLRDKLAALRTRLAARHDSTQQRILVCGRGLPRRNVLSVY
jgi:hypothetical protein